MTDGTDAGTSLLTDEQNVKSQPGLQVHHLDLSIRRTDGKILLLQNGGLEEGACWTLPGFTPEFSGTLRDQVEAYCAHHGLVITGDLKVLDYLEQLEDTGDLGMRLLFEASVQHESASVKPGEIFLAKGGSGGGSDWFHQPPKLCSPLLRAHSAVLFPVRKGLLQSLRKSRQLLRYLIVGVWNTAFGYGTYAGITYLLSPYWEGGYLIASLASGLINLTVSFLGYKWFVFKTQGHYLREWFRALTVYGGAIILNTLLLGPLVLLVQSLSGLRAEAPYIAGGLLLIATVAFSFLGHRHYTFSRSKP